MEATITSGQMPRHSQEFLKERKFFMILPLLILPFLTIGFWALGGGSQKNSVYDRREANRLNSTLPQAQFKDQKSKDKMGVYQTQKQDSANSPGNGVSQSFVRSMGFDEAQKKHADSISKASTINPGAVSITADANEAKIQAKLAQINQQISQPETPNNVGGSRNTGQTGTEVKKLNKLMRSLNSSNDEDPEMIQLNKMLTKIQAIQNPRSLKAEKPLTKENDTAFRAIPAVIDGRQKVVNGGTVRLKLTDSVNIKGVSLKQGQLLFGACEVINQRLLLNIQNIRVGKDILPAALTVFSLDGMPGIPAPEAELSNAAGEGTNSAIENMQFLSMDQSLSTQAAAGGINAAKGLLGKKVKNIKIKLNDQFPVLLKINK